MARLVEGAKAVTFDKDDVIIHEGNRDQRLYQIGIGSVRVEKGPFSTGTLLARLGPGQVRGVGLVWAWEWAWVCVQVYSRAHTYIHIDMLLCLHAQGSGRYVGFG